MDQPILNINFPASEWQPFFSWIRVEEENKEQTKFIEDFKKKRREDAENKKPAKGVMPPVESEKREPKE
jgi:hypothetical protein